MTLALLIRHGHTDAIRRFIAGRSDLPLTDEGHEQARRLAEALGRLPIAAVYTSPLRRARQTAAPLVERLGLSPRLAEGINEVDFGEWTGKSFDELGADPRWRRWNGVRSTSSTPGGESMVAVQRRAAEFLAQLETDHPDETVACFSHGDTIRAALAHCLGVHLDLFLRIEVSIASVSAVELRPWGPRVMQLNRTLDDAPLQPRP